MPSGPSRALRTLVAVVAALASTASMASSPPTIESLEIVRLDALGDARGEHRQWSRLVPDSRAARLADALGRCTTRALVKFKPRYLVAATRADGSETTFLVLGAHVKIDGAAFECRDDVQDLVERLWAEDP